MSTVGSARPLPGREDAVTARGDRSAARRRLLISLLLLVAAIALAVVNAPSLALALRIVTGSPVSTQAELFDRLEPQFRDYSTFARDVRQMEARIGVDTRHLTAIGQLLEADSGIGPALAAFSGLASTLNLDRQCRAADPWSSLVTSVRRDIDTAADGSKRVSLDLLFCVFTVPRDESGLFRYPVATVTLSAAEARQAATLPANVADTDAQQALLWLQAVIKGEVAHLHRLIALRQASTAALSGEIDGELRGYLGSNALEAGGGAPLTLLRAALLLAMIALAAVAVWTALAELRTRATPKAP
jgi:hypothetical protein